MRIGELAQATKTTTKTLRFYEEQGLLRPARSSAGYRDFDEAAATRVEFIHRGKAAGLSLLQIRQILDIHDAGDTTCGHVRTLLDRRLTDLDHQIGQLTTLRATIASLREVATQDDGCNPDQVCSYL